VRRILVACICIAALQLGIPSATSAAEPVQADVIVTLVADAPLDGIATQTLRARRRAVLDSLQDTADQTQTPIRLVLARRARQGLVSVVEPLWVVNGLRVKAAPSVIAELARRPDVRSITPNVALEAPDLLFSGVPTPNQDLINADDLWGLGYRGAGVVVASMDTGVSGSHPDLGSQFRGGTNSWYDAHGQHATPFDAQGHGTMTMGVMVGRDVSGSSVGTAPDAQWVAAKIFDDQGHATVAAIHQSFEWLLDPDGNPATNDAPSVVNNSWAMGTPGCNLEFQPDLQALRASAIVPVFAAGNYGPSDATDTSPANYPEALAVGATDGNDGIWSRSSRGPSSCGGSTDVYPDVVAPGVGIPTTDLFDLHTVGTGTSMAAPHVAGAIALLLDAFPGATPVELESALDATARDLGASGPDDLYGNGRIDILGAYQALAGGSIGDLVFEDRDGDSTRDEGEPGLAGVGLRLLAAGADGQLGTSDDTTVAERVSDAYTFDRLAAGSYRVEVDMATLPDGAQLTTGNLPLELNLAGPLDVRDADFGFQRPPRHVLSFEKAVSAGGSAFAPEDVVVFDGTGFSLLVDGSDVGLAGRNVDAVHIVDGDTLLLSLGADAVVPGVGAVAEADVLRFDATALGATTTGALSVWFDGSDVGLGTSAEDIDALAVLADGRPVVSTLGEARVPGMTAQDEDLLVFTPTTFGTTTAGTWGMWFDGSDVGLRALSENVDGVDTTADGVVRLSTAGAFSVPDGAAVVTGGDESTFDCAPILLGPITQCDWRSALSFDGIAAGLPASADVDALGAL
jgi:subtilisin family serine protease